VGDPKVTSPIANLLGALDNRRCRQELQFLQRTALQALY